MGKRSITSNTIPLRFVPRTAMSIALQALRKPRQNGLVTESRPLHPIDGNLKIGTDNQAIEIIKFSCCSAHKSMLAWV